MTDKNQKSKSVRDHVDAFAAAMVAGDFAEAKRIRRFSGVDALHFKSELRAYLQAHPTESALAAWFAAQEEPAKEFDDSQERAVVRPWSPHEEMMRRLRFSIVNKFGRTAACLSGAG